MVVIDAKGVSKSYGETTAVSDLSLTVDEGELFGFLGPNGAGKTTTIRMLTGQTAPDSGRISVLGLDPSTEPVGVRSRIGILPEKESPMDFLTPREYLHEFITTVRDLDDDEAGSRIETWAERLSMHDKLDTYNTDLSRGQQQKVMIAQAFLHRPDLVFIDEPLANLDPIMQAQMKDFFVDYVERGNTIFLSTHHIEVAEEICTRVGVLDGGELVAVRDVDDVGEDESLLDVFAADVGGDVNTLSDSVTPE